MAVRAHYPSNVLFHSRDESEMNDGEMAPPLFDQSHLFFSSNGENINRWKRAKEATPSAAPSQQQIPFPLQSPAVFDPSSARSQTIPFVSTGLHLALAEQTNNRIKEEQPDSLLTASFSEEIAALINKEDNEIDGFITAQTEQLRREFAKRRQRHYCTLLEAAGNKLLEKEAEVERAGRCILELENRLM
ncbi:uncharacterized protein LOC110030353 [Phalaenopsis equestris]|uniref:uncharacterized protein LOC110030353 n=2 Tax=Phalaenopsis equestris TaxID=78828 RepID=UPI0009E343F3|nr:uncharacterized protein LOC110030353 [Phalaenopsis equestris]